jgi:elongation factor Tu
MTNEIKIETIDDLKRAVDSDQGNHRLKEFAELFITAMTDWPTLNQTRIDGFVKEIKDFYGHLFTLDKIDGKKMEFIQDQDLWRHEAGSTIAELIDQSSKFNNDSDFDSILKRMISYYKKEIKPASDKT